MGRTYDRQLKCGCMISSDGGGGCIPCHYGYGCGKEGCDENNQCNKCIEQEKLCNDTWDEWKQTNDYLLHRRECIENNNSDKYLKQMIEENPDIKKLFETTDKILNGLINNE